MKPVFTLLRPLLHSFPPETVHHLGLRVLQSGLLPRASLKNDPMISLQAFGLTFANPVGLAAGFDKNAAAINPLLKQGFGFIEAGTVTPLAQPGNPQPRIFRLKEDEAVINRLGFNNEGLENFVECFTKRNLSLGIAGANVGKNKDSTDAAEDYVRGLEAVYPHADYITINISSPNTPGLRALQKRDALGQLLSALADAREGCARVLGRRVPLLLKVAPDLNLTEQEDIVHLVSTHGFDGLIISNTTISRPNLRSARREEQGGLSGRPLFALSTEMLRSFYRLTGGRIPLIGVGGIASAEDAYAKIRSGATLVQLYTALVYQGFGLVRDIRMKLPQLLARDGFSHISEAIGADVS